jgi:hypothetical protein
MRFRIAGPGLALITLIAGAADAVAEQVCLPGTGLHCGPGRTDPGTQRYVTRPGRVYVGAPGQAGAALEGAAALVGIVGMLIDIFDRPSSTVSTVEPEDPHLAQIRREKADLLAQAAEANRRGIEYIKKGEDRTAAGYFKRAMQWADQVDDKVAVLTYKRNLFNAIAQGKLKEAIRLERQGSLVAAASLLDEADASARVAGGPELARAVREQRDKLLARNAALPPSQRQIVRARKACTRINGQVICD